MSGAEPLTLRRALAKGALSSGVGLLVVTLAAVLISRAVYGDGALEAVLTRAEPGPILVGSVAMSAAFFFMGLRWRALMPPDVRPPAHGLTALLLAGLLLNYALPGPMGELAAAWFANRRYGVGLADSLASGVAARLVGLITAAVMALIASQVADLPVPPGYERWVDGLALLLGAAALCGALAVALPRPWQVLSAKVLDRLARVRWLERPARRAHGGLTQLADALAAVATRGLGPYLRAAGWSVAGHLTVTVGIALTASGFDAQPDPLGLVFTYCLSTAGAVLLFALPGSQLSWDAGFLALLVGACGLELSDALAVTTVVRFQQVALQALGGASLAWLLSSSGSPPLGLDTSTPVRSDPRDPA